MQYWGLTDPGCARSQNQDVYHIEMLDRHTLLCIICDGMGGARAGNVASAVAVEAFSAALEDSCRQGIPDDPDKKRSLLFNACLAANAQVYELSATNQEYFGMGTTLVAALILPSEVYVVNIGDSRCYIWHEGTLTQVTSDHSLVQALVDCGDITPEEARTHPKKNVITRALGVEEEARCDIFAFERHDGDKLLLCSDGLSNAVTDETMTMELSAQISAEDTAKVLLSRAVEQGAPDNVTVILAKL